MKTFTCSRCHQEKEVNTTGVTTGYAVGILGDYICYACCGEIDREHMRKYDKTTLYLSFELQNPRIGWNDYKAEVTNWPGTLRISLHGVRVGRHNIARRRYDVRFTLDGNEWHGVQYGDFTQILHCRKLKKKTT